MKVFEEALFTEVDADITALRMAFACNQRGMASAAVEEHQQRLAVFYQAAFKNRHERGATSATQRLRVNQSAIRSRLITNITKNPSL